MSLRAVDDCSDEGRREWGGARVQDATSPQSDPYRRVNSELVLGSPIDQQLIDQGLSSL